MYEQHYADCVLQRAPRGSPQPVPLPARPGTALSGAGPRPAARRQAPPPTPSLL